MTPKKLTDNCTKVFKSYDKELGKDDKERIEKLDIKFNDIHGYNYKSDAWRSELDSFSSSFGNVAIYKELFDLLNKDAKAYTNFIKNIGTFIKLKYGKFDEGLSKIKIPTGVDEKWKEIIKNLTKEISDIKKNINEDQERKKYEDIIKSFPDMYILILGKINTEASGKVLLKASEFKTYYKNRLSTSDKNSKNEKESNKILKYLEQVINLIPYSKENDEKSVPGKSIVKPKAKEESSNDEKFMKQKEKIMEHLTLARLWYNCSLRVEEGNFINQSLIEMKEQIKDLIIESNSSLSDPNVIYWDTLYHPYCYNLNILSESVFEAPKKSENESVSMIIKQIKKLAGMDEKTKVPLQFLVFTVINTSFNPTTNNPPNPPFVNISLAKDYYESGNMKELAKEVSKIIKEALNPPEKDGEDDPTPFFYANNQELKEIPYAKINEKNAERYFKQIVDIFDKNNSATLIGTLETTEIVQKLNMKYLCTSSEKKVDILDKFSNSLRAITIKSDGNFSGKYNILY